uniref:Cytochrome P450 n=1 Tax=uncultured bacterium A1Q1_fos_2140 TaxID=1256565 RepID=L7VS72_9BACT|nr:cytochrome P450 [uncultured bacterium A1Q1_fos_2140]
MQASLLDMKINNTPRGFAEFMRERGDIFWWEKGNFWLITSHELAKNVLNHEAFSCDRAPFFISRMPNLDLNLIGDFFSVVGKMMVMSDTDQHRARRRICYDGFGNKTLENLSPLIQKTIEKQIQECLKKGSIEFVEDFAQVIPCTILADFFHIPEEERRYFYQWSNNMTQFFGGASQYRNEDGIEVNNSAKNLDDYFRDLIKKRRKNPANDFLSVLLKNQQAFGLDDDEIRAQAIMMLVAGQVTTTDQLCNNVYTVMTNPALLHYCQHEARDFKPLLDELNRLDPAVTFIFRVTKTDTRIGEQKIKAGDVIFISTHSVNRDPAVFENPHECLPERNLNPQLSYGFGPHYCIGAKLARLEMENMFQQLFQRFPGLSLKKDDLPVRKHHSLAFSGFERLPLAFDRSLCL